MSATSPLTLLPINYDFDRAEMAEEAFSPANYYVCAAKVWGTGVLTEYAIAKAHICGCSIHLNFTVNTKPPKEMTDFLHSSEFTQLPKTVEEFSHKKRTHSVWGRTWSDGTNKVTKVFLNLYFYHPPELSSILVPIGEACRSIFPHMISKKSPVTVYYGINQWNADRIFKPQAQLVPATSIMVRK